MFAFVLLIRITTIELSFEQKLLKVIFELVKLLVLIVA